MESKSAASQAFAQGVTRQRELEPRHAVEMAAFGARYEQSQQQRWRWLWLTARRHGTVRLRRAWIVCEQQWSQTSATLSLREAHTSAEQRLRRLLFEQDVTLTIRSERDHKTLRTQVKN